MKQGSGSFLLNGIDWDKIGIGALVAIAGAMLTYVSSIITEIDFGTWTPLIVALWSIIANIVRKWVSDNS